MGNRCGECSKFIQHYAFLEGKLRKVWCGHCTDTRKKMLHQDKPACDLFTPGESVEEKLVNQEYLTKTLLQKVLSMKLWEKE